MKTILYIILGCLIVLLSACTPRALLNNVAVVKTTTVTKITPTRIQPLTCRQICDIKAEKCHARCRNNCAQCTAFADQSTKKSYNRYQREKVIEGGVIARQLKSYRDPLQCRKTTCSCKADYQLCISGCGGVIRKQLKAAPVC